MATLNGYFLNLDAWDYTDPETKKTKRYVKGDKLDGIKIDDDRLEYLLATGNPNRPTFVKDEKDVYGAEASDASAVEYVPTQPQPARSDTGSKPATAPVKK